MVGRACVCGGVITGSPPTCDRCGPIRSASNAAPPLTADRSVYHNSSRWRSESARFKEKYPYCCVCLLLGVVNGKRGRDGLLVDHIVPATMLPGGTTGAAFWDKSNWQVICLDCDLRYKKPLEQFYTDPIDLQTAWSRLLFGLRVEAANRERDSNVQ